MVDALRAEAAAMREWLSGASGPAATPEDVLSMMERGVEARLDAGYAPSLVAVINATLYGMCVDMRNEIENEPSALEVAVGSM